MSTARKNDPNLPLLAQRMYSGGLGFRAISRMIGVHYTTVKYYVRSAGLPLREGTPMAEAPLLEPTGVDNPICFVCHGRSLNWDGHDQCRGRRKAA